MKIIQRIFSYFGYNLSRSVDIRNMRNTYRIMILDYIKEIDELRTDAIENKLYISDLESMLEVK